MACPKVWPRFSSARPPSFAVSFSSARHHAGLELATAADDRHQVVAPERQGRPLQPRQQLRVAEQSRLDDLRAARGKLARRQRAEQPGRDEHPARLVKSAHEVLPRLEIDPGLPSTELSTIASSVVGTWLKAMPRR